MKQRTGNEQLKAAVSSWYATWRPWHDPKDKKPEEILRMIEAVDGEAFNFENGTWYRTFKTFGVKNDPQ